MVGTLHSGKILCFLCNFYCKREERAWKYRAARAVEFDFKRVGGYEYN